MSNKNVISARVSDDVLAMIDRIAAMRDRSRAWIVSHLLENAAREEMEFRDFLQVGIDSADRGDLMSQAEVEKWFEERKGRRAEQIAAE
jgi:predicted transcriptional regulator